MKYKVGDRVKIKTWDKMKDEQGFDGDDYIKSHIGAFSFLLMMDQNLNKFFPDRVLRIRAIVKRDHYYMEAFDGYFHDYMIDCLSKDYIEPISIENRFEILDL